MNKAYSFQNLSPPSYEYGHKKTRSRPYSIAVPEYLGESVQHMVKQFEKQQEMRKASRGFYEHVAKLRESDGVRGVHEPALQYYRSRRNYNVAQRPDSPAVNQMQNRSDFQFRHGSSVRHRYSLPGSDGLGGFPQQHPRHNSPKSNYEASTTRLEGELMTENESHLTEYRRRDGEKDDRQRSSFSNSKKLSNNGNHSASLDRTGKFQSQNHNPPRNCYNENLRSPFGPLTTSMRRAVGRLPSYQSRSKSAKILVVCNSDYEDKVLSSLPGYEADYNTLRDLSKLYNMEFFSLVNQTAEVISYCLKKFAESFSGEEYFCAVFVLAHGGQHDEIYGYDGHPVRISSILKCFDNKCENLQHMPKLFFFQCCRGVTRSQGVPQRNETAIAASVENLVPRTSDTFVAFATQAGDVSLVPDYGSWFIQDLAKVWRDYGEQEHLAELMTQVNDMMAHRRIHNSIDPDLASVKLMSDYRSSLRRKLYLRKAPKETML